MLGSAEPWEQRASHYLADLKAMPLLRSVLYYLARRVAADPRVQAQSERVYREEVRPRAKQLLNATEPRIKAARKEIATAVERGRSGIHKVKRELRSRVENPKGPE